MIVVDLTACEPPEGWRKRAEIKTKILTEDVLPEDRNEYRRNNATWGEVKDQFSNASFGKCWYCETLVSREYGAVDHFRPKGRVLNTTHLGYWWLAYDWKNYRFSCTFCNSPKTNPETGEVLGKRNLFPLLDEGQRALDSTHDIVREQPILLDPVVDEDPPLLWFSPRDGGALPAVNEDKDRVAFRRAMESLLAYHLNYPTTREERKELFDAVQVDVDNIVILTQVRRALKEDATEALTQKIDTQLERLGQKIATCISPKAQYSAAVLAFLKSLPTPVNLQEVIADAKEKP